MLKIKTKSCIPVCANSIKCIFKTSSNEFILKYRPHCYPKCNYNIFSMNMFSCALDCVPSQTLKLYRFVSTKGSRVRRIHSTSIQMLQILCYQMKFNRNIESIRKWLKAQTQTLLVLSNGTTNNNHSIEKRL